MNVSCCLSGDVCNQGGVGKSTWSKPDQQRQTRPPLAVQESLPSDGALPVPESSLPENGEEGSTGGSATCPPVDAAIAAKTSPRPEAGEPIPQGELQGEPIGLTPADLSPSPPVNGVLRFDVTVVKEAGEGYGLAHVSAEDGSNTLMIVAIADLGPIVRWNDSRQDEKTVRRGDRIVAVGGICDDLEAMKGKLRQGSGLFTLERWPDIIVVPLFKRSPADKYGLSTQRLQQEDGGVVLQVTQIGEGLMSEWNHAACQSRRFHEIVTPSFDIVKLHELAGDPEKMQEALMTRDSVELTFRRPDPSVFHK